MIVKSYSSKYALSKAEAATLRSSLSQEQETTRALRAELASVQSSDDVEADVSVYRATIERLTTAVSEKAHSVTSARVRSRRHQRRARGGKRARRRGE